jgi:hypothetical protein
MKKNVNLDDILDYIAVEKAPDGLIYKWKAELEIQKERKTILSVFFRPSIVISIIFAGLWYYFVILKETLIEYNFLDKTRSLLAEISPAAADHIPALVSSNYYIIGAAIFSVLLAGASLLWFYQVRKPGYSVVRNW